MRKLELEAFAGEEVAFLALDAGTFQPAAELEKAVVVAVADEGVVGAPEAAAEVGALLALV